MRCIPSSAVVGALEGVPRGCVKPGGGFVVSDGDGEDDEEEGFTSKPEVRGTGFCGGGARKAPRPVPFAAGLFLLYKYCDAREPSSVVFVRGHTQIIERLCVPDGEAGEVP